MRNKYLYKPCCEYDDRHFIGFLNGYRNFILTGFSFITQVTISFKLYEHQLIYTKFNEFIKRNYKNKLEYYEL